jgi:uncharacterized protein
MSSLDAVSLHAPAVLPSPPPASRPPRPLGLWMTFGWTEAGLAAAMLLAILTVAAGAIWNAVHPGRPFTQDQIMDLAQVGMSAGFLLLLGMIVLACRRSGWRAADYLALTRPQGRYVRLCAVAFVVPLAVTMSLALSGFSLAADDEVPKTIASLAVTLIAMAVVAPVWEELVFRGFVYRGLAASRLGVVGAIVLTSLLWAGLHFDKTWLGLAETFFCGLVWGWLRWRTGSTIATTAVHCLNNATAAVAVSGITLGWWT